MQGVVREFDEHRGIGVLVSDEGGAYPFHCTRIVGADRTIPVGVAVEFDIAPGLPGRWEAIAIHAMMEPRSSPGS